MAGALYCEACKGMTEGVMGYIVFDILLLLVTLCCILSLEVKKTASVTMSRRGACQLLTLLST